MNTANWVKLHGYVSMFFLPLALIYAITGALIIVGERGNLAKEKHVVTLENQSLEEIEAQKKLIGNFLSSLGEKKLPSGEPRFARGELSWGVPSGLNLSLSKGENPGEAVLEIRRPDLLFSLVILHRARGGRVFDYLGFAFAVAMMMMYLSGIFIFWKIKNKRIWLTLTFAVGVFVTLLAVFFSR